MEVWEFDVQDCDLSWLVSTLILLVYWLYLSHPELSGSFLSHVVSDILKIDNLWEFVNLTKLQLDNNIIEKIEALDSLVNLVWLGKVRRTTSDKSASAILHMYLS